MIIYNSQERTRFLRFAVVGTIGAVVDFGVFNLLTLLFHFIPIVASMCSFGAAVISNFFWNRHWTYPDSRSKPLGQQVIQFIVVSVVGLLIRTPIFAGSEKFLIQTITSLHLNLPLTPTVIGHNIALAFAVIVVMFWNFFANRFWTYNDVQAHINQPVQEGK